MAGPPGRSVKIRSTEGAFTLDTSGHNPLNTDDSRTWNELIQAVGPSSLLVVIESRMGAAIRSRFAPEDILQDVLLLAWRDRKNCEWRGLQAFRSWLLTLIEHRLADASDHINAIKRGGPGIGASGAPRTYRETDVAAPEPVATTTPSRIAIYAEQASAMREALDRVPEDCREIVRLRLFEERTASEIAVRLQIGESAVRHRFRRGAAAYQRALAEVISSRSSRIATDERSESAP